jgi:hypothetical protein
MARLAMVVILAAVLGACAEEKITVRESSIAKQFSMLNKSGWQVTSNAELAQKASEPKREVRVLKEADFSGLMFRTNFQIDDPQLKEQQKREQEKQRQEEATNPPATPFGPWIPGR